jgi:hypothetical protein
MEYVMLAAARPADLGGREHALKESVALRVQLVQVRRHIVRHRRAAASWPLDSGRRNWPRTLVGVLNLVYTQLHCAE